MGHNFLVSQVTFMGGTKGFCNFEIVFKMIFHGMIHLVKNCTDFGLPDTFGMSEKTGDNFHYHCNQELKFVSYEALFPIHVKI